MIGKMYRPLKILSIPGKRGFNILNKYKSNFGGIEKFNQQIYLNYDAENGTEVINVDFVDIQAPIVVSKDMFVGKSENEVVSNVSERAIKSLRKMSRPQNLCSKDNLEFLMKIEAVKDVKANTEDNISLEEFENVRENDLLTLKMTPVIVDNVEYLRVEATCNTPVVITTNTSILIDRS